MLSRKGKALWNSLKKRKALWNSSCHLLKNLVMREHHLPSNGNQAKQPLHILLWKLLKGCRYETDFFPKDVFWGDLVKYPFQAPEVKPLQYNMPKYKCPPSCGSTLSADLGTVNVRSGMSGPVWRNIKRTVQFKYTIKKTGADVNFFFNDIKPQNIINLTYNDDSNFLFINLDNAQIHQSQSEIWNCMMLSHYIAWHFCHSWPEI